MRVKDMSKDELFQLAKKYRRKHDEIKRKLVWYIRHQKKDCDKIGEMSAQIEDLTKRLRSADK